MKGKMRRRSDRRNEKGAALVIAILIATLLLAVAGTVILTSGMSATTSIEGTAELQAYYAAESGLEATLNALRGHVAPNGLPATTKIGFRTAVDPDTSNHPSDGSSVARLSAWLNYNLSTGRVTPTGANYSYSVVVMDPDDPLGTTRDSDATYKPWRIQVQSTGYGPKGAVKHMEMIVQKTHFEFDPKAMLTMRGADDGSPTNMTFDIGDSAAKYYSGQDNAGGSGLPTFGVTNAADLGIANDAITKGATVADVKTAQLDMATLPSWLQDADAARAFLNDMQMVARSLGRYYTSFDGMAGSEAEPKVTMVNGNATLDGGAGLLIVTGNLVMNGNPSFKGIILVLGEGTINRDGGGNGNIYGSIYVAKFARSWPASENGLEHPFLAPTFHTDGGGTADLRYDSEWVQKAKDALGDIVRDVREY